MRGGNTRLGRLCRTDWPKRGGNKKADRVCCPQACPAELQDSWPHGQSAIAVVDIGGALTFLVTRHRPSFALRVALRDEGMALHEAGNHADSEAKLADAMRRLLLAL